jgi:hypothetical protein
MELCKSYVPKDDIRNTPWVNISSEGDIHSEHIIDLWEFYIEGLRYNKFKYYI